MLPDEAMMVEEGVCWYCDGAGGWHECMDDCCACLDPDEITITCSVCNGKGYLEIVD